MNVKVDVRHHVYPSEARAYAESRLAKDERLQGVDQVHVVLDEDHGRTRAEVVLTLAKGATVVAETLEKDFRTAIDRLADKAGRQVRKHQDRVRRRRPNGDRGKGG